ncbi:MAG: glycoside hydrolase family 32 protein [Oscillospiraceae bacterium]|nr:glycoside hydrolase family 32 protein [Oscillospiraceae bacterium]
MNALQKDLIRLTEAAERQTLPDSPWRLGLHLMPPVGWLNDPNGLCFFRGEYHVFYQYSPFHAEGGVKFWGHYKSRDMISWEQCPVMLYSDETFDVHGAYSGSALCEEDGMYLFYTGNVKHGGDYDHILNGRENNTALACSPDGVQLAWKRLLMKNTDYPGEMTLHVRDPKVWKQDGKYYMVLGARTRQDAGAVLLFASEDKTRWEHINTLRTPEAFGYMWECPDLFEIDGQWFLAVSPQGVTGKGPGLENVYASGYFPLSGDFRNECALGEFVPFDFGFDFYAPQSFSDGTRRIQIGWMGMPDAEYSNPTAAQGWQHCLTVPREVTMQNGRLLLNPVRELETLREESWEYSYSGKRTIDLPVLSDILIACEDGELSLNLSGVSLKTSGKLLILTVQEDGYGRQTRTAPVERLKNLRILADTSALEIYVNGGEQVLSVRWYPEGGRRTLTLTGKGSAVVCRLRALRIEKYALS